MLSVSCQYTGYTEALSPLKMDQCLREGQRSNYLFSHPEKKSLYFSPSHSMTVIHSVMGRRKQSASESPGPQSHITVHVIDCMCSSHHDIFLRSLRDFMGQFWLKTPHWNADYILTVGLVQKAAEVRWLRLAPGVQSCWLNSRTSTAFITVLQHKVKTSC